MNTAAPATHAARSFGAPGAAVLSTKSGETSSSHRLTSPPTKPSNRIRLTISLLRSRAGSGWSLMFSAHRSVTESQLDESVAARTVTASRHPNAIHAMTAAMRMNTTRKTNATRKSRGRSSPESSAPILRFQESDGSPLGVLGRATDPKLVTRVGRTLSGDPGGRPLETSLCGIAIEYARQGFRAVACCSARTPGRSLRRSEL